MRNGVDLSFFDDQLPVDEGYARELGVEGRFVAAYVGTHGMAHGLDTLLDAARLLRHREDIVLLTAGDGAEREQIVRRVEQGEVHKVTVLDQIRKNDRCWLC